MVDEIDFEIISTPEFTDVSAKIWPEKPLAAICRDVAQSFYRADPLGRGLYKLRMAAPGRGKRGGARVIFMYVTRDQRVLLLTAYTKAKQETLTKQQLERLSEIGKLLLDEGDWEDGQESFRLSGTRPRTGRGV